MEVKNIFQRMSAITTELQTVAKNLTVQQTKTSSYKAVSERDILDAVKPVEAKHGVYSYPVKRTILESNMLESDSTYNGNTTKKTTFMTRIETVYRFVNVDKPEEYIETITYAEGIDTQDKGSGKAMTYSDKYALMKAYKISTGDDPDQDASKETHYTAQKQATHRQPEPQQPKAEEVLVNENHIAALLLLMERKGVTSDQILSRYKAKRLKELNMADYMRAVQALEKTPDKPKLDLGL